MLGLLDVDSQKNRNPAGHPDFTTGSRPATRISGSYRDKS